MSSLTRGINLCEAIIQTVLQKLDGEVLLMWMACLVNGLIHRLAFLEVERFYWKECPLPEERSTGCC